MQEIEGIESKNNAREIELLSALEEAKANAGVSGVVYTLQSRRRRLRDLPRPPSAREAQSGARSLAGDQLYAPAWALWRSRTFCDPHYRRAWAVERGAGRAEWRGVGRRLREGAAILSRQKFVLPPDGPVRSSSRHPLCRDGRPAVLLVRQRMIACRIAHRGVPLPPQPRLRPKPGGYS